MSKKKTMTAQELLDQLSSDADYQEKLKRIEEERNDLIKKQENEMRPFYDELNRSGLKTNYFDGVSEQQLNSQVVEIIIKHLEKGYSKNVNTILIQMLDTKKAGKETSAKLMSLYKTVDNDLRNEIGHVLNTIATESDVPGLLRLLNSSEIDDGGKSNLPVVLSRLMGKQIVPILVEALQRRKNLSENNLFAITCVEQLGKLKALDGKEFAEYYLNHSDSWYRSQAKKALQKINSIKTIVSKLPKGIKYISDNKIDYKYEISTEIDSESLSEFFEMMVAKLNVNLEPHIFEDLILDADLDETKTYEIEVREILRPTKLYFQIFMDDVDTPALSFYSRSKSLIKSISSIIDRF